MPEPDANQQDRPLGERLFEALTQQEISLLLDALFAALPSELHEKVLNQLEPDTRQTVQQLLFPSPVSQEVESSRSMSISYAKLAQTWADLWGEWYDIVEEAAQEEGDYITQEAHWEAPYFDETAFIGDLEKVAERMRPLIPVAVEYAFSPGISFVEAIMGAEEEVSEALPEWIDVEGYHLEENLTRCVLDWEWLEFQETERDAFAFVQHLLDLQKNLSNISLDSNALVDFLTELPETEQKDIFQELTQHSDTLPWQELLSSPHSPWYAFYIYCTEQYAPERYLDVLRSTIPQQWQNGLPVIEDLLAKKEYRESLAVINDTLQVMLKSERIDENWTPETALLFATIPWYYNNGARLEAHKMLLDYYQQAAVGLNQTELANTLQIQLVTFDHCFHWKTMFETFLATPVSPRIRQALFVSWRDSILQRTRPQSWDYGRVPSKESWWLGWLIDSVYDKQKGAGWFQQKITGWLAQLSGDLQAPGEDYQFLRLLTQDLSEINKRYQEQYPQFYRVVIRPGESSTADHASRQAYLKQYMPNDLLERVMTYWQVNLHNFVPRPEAVQKSDYTSHAQWLVALRELAPQQYEALLHKWQVEHHRRRNLWAALNRLGLP